VHRGPYAKTWRAQSPQPEYNTLSFIVKVYNNYDPDAEKAMDAGATIHAEIQRRCGTGLTPRLYGLYQWPDGGGLLLMDDVGQSLKGDGWDTLSTDDK
jgi:hypothetical protein